MKTSVKVEINESKPDYLVDLAEKVLVKHKAMGTSSPLNSLDMTTFEQNLKLGKANRADAKRLHDEAEKLNQQANLNLGIGVGQTVSTPGTVYSSLARVRDVLLGIHKGQEKNLNEWGFDVIITEGTNGRRSKPSTK